MAEKIYKLTADKKSLNVQETMMLEEVYSPEQIAFEIEQATIKLDFWTLLKTQFETLKKEIVK